MAKKSKREKLKAKAIADIAGKNYSPPGDDFDFQVSDEILKETFPWDIPMPGDGQAIWDANLAWSGYLCDRQTPARAIIALEKIVKANLTIPSQLLPWVVKACETWKEQKLNKRQCRNIATREKWENAIYSIEGRRAYGEKSPDAFESTALELNCAVESIKRKYSHKDFRKFREHARNSWKLKIVLESHLTGK